MENPTNPTPDISSLKDKTISGMIWSFVERFGYLFLQFATNLILARLLSPNEFGVIGILLIIVNMSLVFVDSGLGTALIQKKAPTNTDFSTIFIANIAIGVIVYIIIFISAPQLAIIFKVPELTSYLRIIGLCILIDAFGVVQNSILQKNLNFKTYAIIRIVSILISSVIAIVCAFMGLGVWSLIIQHVLFSIIRVGMLWIYSKWKVYLQFSWQSFKQLYNYAYKLLISQLLGEGFFQLQSAIVGKYFSPSTLGYYTQAQQLESIPVSTLSRIVNQVSFSTFSAIQENRLELKRMVRKNMTSLIFLNAPLMFLLAVVAEPLIVTLYTDKWLESVPIFQWLCLGFGLLLIVHQTNLLVLKAVGKSDIVLKLQIIKITIGFILIFAGIQLYGLQGLLVALTLYSIIELFLNASYISKEIGYNISEQLRDLSPSILLSLSVGAICLLVSNHLYIHHFLKLIIVSLLYACLYLVLARIFKMSQLKTYMSIISNKIKHKI